MTDDPDPDDRSVNVVRFWTGGAVVAVVAALMAVLGGLFARGVFDVAILVPRADGSWGDGDSAAYVGLSAFVTLSATGIMHFLLLVTPRATQLFGWIMVLVALIAAVLPLTEAADIGPRIATAMLNLVIGLVITGLLVGVARSGPGPATRRTGSDQYWPERPR